MKDSHNLVADASSIAKKPASNGGAPKPQKVAAFPLSYAQQRLWFVEQLEPDTPAYLIPCALRLEGELNVGVLERSLNEIVRRHEALRTSIVVHEGRPLQKIASDLKVAIEETDLRDVPLDRREEEARRMIRVMAGMPFDLARAPLIRVNLFRLGEQSHVLLVIMHHIVSDGWSIGVLIREFSGLYLAYTAGMPSPLEPLKIQYLDYAIWQHKWLKGEVLEEQIRYWREQLAGIETLALPADRSPQHGTHAAGTLNWELPEDLSRELNDLGRREGATLFMTLLAGFHLLLSSYTGQDDIAIGTPVAGRRSLETEPLIGFFVNTLVLRSRFNAEMSFRQFLSQVREITVQAYAHQDVPFEKLVEELRPKRDTGLTPFFQVMFILQNAPHGELSLPGLKLSEVEIEAETAKFYIKVTATETRQLIRGKLEYRADLFSANSITRLLRHWKNLLAAIVHAPEKPVRSLSMLTDVDEQQILKEWNDAKLDSPQPDVIQVFEARAKRSPEAVALEFGTQRVSYGELRDQSNSMARSLISAGTKPGDLVLVLTAERPKLVAAMIGALKAGCGFVPMSLNLPDQRIATMIAECAPQWAIVDADQQSRCEQLTRESGQQITVVAIDFADKSGDASLTARTLSNEQPAYIFFTSGSTGKPKPIAGRLKGINHFIHWEIRKFGIGPQSRIAQLTSPMFDPILRDVFVPLCSGGTLCIPADPDLALKGNELAQWLESEKISLVHTVPSVFRAMLNNCGPHRFSDLKYVLLAGEPVLPSDVRHWHELVGNDGAGLVNLYGPSETTMVKFCYPVRWEDARKRAISIGSPMEGAAAILIDKNGKVCPPGVVGEIYIRTPYGASGYYQRPELTAQVFVPNPFSNDPQDIVYKTGDLARILEDGNFELLGRRDDQVKIRGVRIELGEIESALSACQGVAAAAVVAHESEGGEKRLAGYVAGKPGATLDGKDLRKALKEHLPEFMVPQAIVVLDEMPLTPNGKINRKALPEPEISKSGLEHTAPRNPEEEILCGIWAEVLKRQQVGIHDDFFEVGGHSLLATQVIARIRSVLGVELPLRCLFESPTVAGLMEHVERLRSAGQVSLASSVQAADRSRPLPLSYSQQRLWFLNHLRSGNAAYNMPCALVAKGPLRLDLVERSLDHLVERHEVLRTVFGATDGTPRQIIHSGVRIEIPLIDLSTLPPEQRNVEARRRVKEESGKPFDLSRGPLVRGQVLKLAEQEHIVLITMHHIVSDAWSIGIMVREFGAVYAAYLAEETPSLPELKIQYADYAVWQHEWLNGKRLEEQLSFWRKQVEGAPVVELPLDRPRPALLTHHGARLKFILPAELTQKLNRLSRREGATLFMVLLAAFKALLHRYNGMGDISIGTPIAGRTRTEFEGLIGFFINMLVLRTQFGPASTFSELLGNVRRAVIEAYSHQELPFEKLVDELQPERDLGRSPLFQAAFALQNMELTELRLPGLHLQGFPEGDDECTAKFDLLLIGTEIPAGLQAAIEYNTDLFDHSTIERMAHHLELLLESVVVSPGQILSAIPLLSEAERQTTVSLWSGPETHPAPAQTICEVVSNWAATTPDAVALQADGVKLTYADLNTRAARVAQCLLAAGLADAERIAICTTSSADLLVSALGVLKIGSAFVALDPDGPAARSQFILRDARASLVITEAQWSDRFANSHRVLLLERLLDQLDHAGVDAPNTRISSETLASIAYRSGPLGQPEGIMVSHRDLCTSLPLEITSSDMVAFATPVGSMDLFAALSMGASAIVISDLSASPGKLARMLRDHAVTVAIISSSALEQLAREFPWALNKVRYVLCPGSAPVLGRLHGKLSPDVLKRAYGIYRPIDGLSLQMAYPVEPLSEEFHAVSMEHLPHGTKLYLLDAHLQPVPDGVLGEVFVGGLFIEKQNHQSAGTTATDQELRLFKTGDAARRRYNGQLEFKGRLDRRMALDSGNVHPQEIEAALKQHPAVQHAVVVARDIAENNRAKLAAFIVPAGDHSDLAQQLEKFLLELLPEWMVPQAFITLESMPVLRDGEVDYAMLARMLDSKRPLTAGLSYVAPRNELEQRIAEIWAQTIGLERAGIHNNFFDLGGHSLLATQVVARLNDAFQIDLPLESLFETPTVAELAITIDALSQTGSKEVSSIVPADRSQAVPLSFAQERLWFLDQLEPGSASYNIPVGYKLQGTLNQEALEKSFNEIIRRHESLRTTFPVRDGKPVQEIAAEMLLTIAAVDLSGLPEPRRTEEARRHARAEAETPFDLVSGPLVRAKLLRLSGTEHLLLATMHHIVSDGWSMILLAREFTMLYEAFVQGNPSPLAPLKVQYGDFAVWQRNWLQGEVLDQQLGYWKKQLSGVTALELPTDKPRPAVLSEQGADFIFELDEEESRKLRGLAQQEQATVFMVLLAALDVLLWRYSGQNDITVGTGIANRNRVETEGMIGFFVNTLVLRSNIQGRSNARELLRTIRQTTLEAYRYQDLPFEKLVGDLQPERDLGRTPLFQVALVLQNFKTQEFLLPALQVSTFEPAQSAAKTELRFLLDDTTAKIKGSITYVVDLYGAETIVRMSAHWRRLLNELTHDADRMVSELALMDESERRQVLEQWSAPEEYPFWTGGIGKLFARQAAETPEAAAVIWSEGQISYEELARRVWQLARYLKNLGVGPETAVGICLDPGVELITAFFATIAAGATYVPLDPDYPQERLAYMMEDTRPAIVLTEKRFAEHLPGNHGKRVCIDHEWSAIAKCSSQALETGVSPDNLLYVVYTSGSTGRPKGVGVSQGAMVSRALFLAGYYQSRVADRSLQILSPSFDAFGGGLYSTLLTGGAIVFIRPEQMLEPAGLCAAMEQIRVTTLRIPVGYLRDLLSYALRNGITLPGSLRLIITGGETISRAEMREWLRRTAPQARFIHEYGPTETTITATLFEDDLEAEELASPHRFLIGKPNANTRMYVLGEEMEPVAVGAIGELYIGGASLARGYTGDPIQTAEKFVPHPFSASGERLYRTGDWGRWLADGTLEFVGRRDSQVKIRGYRIELGEVETALRQHPGIKDAAVIARESKSGGKHLVAYIVSGTTPAPAAGELQKHLEEKLPSYMVPSAFVAMAELPYMQGGGKLDRKALPEPAESAGQVQSPRTPTEEILCDIWAQVLKLSSVGIDQNFFALGGHSLLATQVIARIRQVFSVELPLRVLFEAQTVATLAERIDALKHNSAGSEIPAIRRASRENPLPLSYAQQRLWFLDQLQPGNAAYNIPFRMRLIGELDCKAVQDSIRELMQRHEVLRTSFPAHQGKPVQKIAAGPEFAWEELDLRHMEEAARAAEVSRLAREDSATGFDLARGPMLRVKLVWVSEQEHVLLVNMHHIVSDGWSVEIMLREFGQLYQGRVKGEQARLPELPVQYADYAVWQREWLDGEVLDRQISYWRQQLADIDVVELPTDRPRPALMSSRGARIKVGLGRELRERLKEHSRAEGVTLFMTLLAAWEMLLGRYSGQQDVAVGTPIAGRTRSEISGLVGFFVNTLVLRTHIGGEMSWRELLEQVRERTMQAYEHQDVPFEKLVEELQPERDLSRQPFFQVMFGLQNTGIHHDTVDGDRREKLGNVTMVPLEFETEAVTAKFDLMLLVMESNRGIEGLLEYNTDLFDRETVDTMVRRWELVLEQVVEIRDGQQRVREITLLNAAERRQLAEQWRGPEVKLGEALVGKSVAEEARRRPQAMAMVSGERRLTYAALDREANQWAHTLLRRGLKMGMRVVVCVGADGQQAMQDMQAMVVWLGVLKAGGVLVGLEAEEPRLRIARMLSRCSAGMPWVITTRDLAEKFTGQAVELLYVEDCREQVQEASTAEPQAVGVNGDSAACVLYRSGAAGPSGVVINHRSLCAPGFATSAETGGPERVVISCDFAHEAASLEVFRTLARGGCVVNVVGGVKLRPRELAALLRNEAVTVWWAGAAEIERIAGEFPWALRNLQRVMCEERFSVLAHLRKKLPQEIQHRVYGVYGYSEAGGAALRCSLASLNHGALPVEEVAAGVRLYLLDEQREPAGAGMAGEIYIGGEWIAARYDGDAERSRHAFVRDPYNHAAEAQMYRTGDWGWRRSDGQLQYLGRRVGGEDEQWIISGVRVAAGEIEAALLEHEQVSEAAVVMREGAHEDEGNGGLAAVVVGKAGHALVEEQLHAFLEMRLPQAMVPRSFTQVEALKTDADGRVDRRAALRMLEGGQGAGAELPYQAPRTRMEELVAEVWAQTFQLERVGVHENFFRLGGHSLLATQVVARLNDALGSELPLQRLFEAPTVAALARLIEQETAGEKQRAPKIVRASRDQALPLSYSQQRLWFLDQLESGKLAYNLPAVIRLRGELNTAVLHAAVEEIVRRHEVLRTTFPSIEGHPYQKIDATPRFPLEFVDLSSLPSDQQEPRLSELVFSEAQQPFDLAQGPLLRGALYKLHENDHVLCFTVHHIVFDAVSVGIFLRELSVLYEAFMRGNPSPLPDPPLQFADVALWERNWLQGEVLERHLQYWRKHLEGAPRALELQADFPRPPVQSFRGGTHRVQVSAELSRALRQFSLDHSSTEYITLLALINIWLFHYSKQPDILVGTPVSNRKQIETEAVIGFFINTLVFRNRITPEENFATLVDLVRMNVLEGHTHQVVPFEMLVQELQIERDPSRNPLFQVMFNMENASAEKIALPGIEIEPMRSGALQARFDLYLVAVSRPTGFELTCNYSTDLFRPATIENMLNSLAELARLAVERPEARICDLTAALAQFEQKQLIARSQENARQKTADLRAIRRRAGQ